MFGREYENTARDLLKAVTAGIDACGETGYGIQVSAAATGPAANVEKTQNAIRELLNKLGSVGGIMGTLFEDHMNPLRFAYDPDGALKTWTGIAELSNAVMNPAPLAQMAVKDPAKFEAIIKGLARTDEWSRDRPMLAASQNIAAG
ncbi:hypothetical protein MSAR_13850 [Mycolicibacterium sarraceniae]|uniref:Uncharacterized protein n=2 Tax=Mycolicibacterium sarraceniae TaxID=1534348 RepID=A0A7I7SQ35_9MYCO|nr:hypothetical protein MSAR_13850 [Mycolicibacterium sarraceniae]